MRGVGCLSVDGEAVVDINEIMNLQRMVTLIRIGGLEHIGFLPEQVHLRNDNLQYLYNCQVLLGKLIAGAIETIVVVLRKLLFSKQ